MELELPVTIEDYTAAKPFEYDETRRLMFEAYDNKEWVSNVDTELTLYRGTCDNEGLDCDPMSWTTDKQVAKWFAMRNAKGGTSTPLLLTATFPPESILYNIGGSEAEVLVDTRDLYTLCLIEECECEELEFERISWGEWA